MVIFFSAPRLLSHPARFIPLLGTTNSDRLTTYMTAFQYVGQMSVDQWWSIAGAGGLCPLGDSQCNYSEYMAHDRDTVKKVISSIVDELFDDDESE